MNDLLDHIRNEFDREVHHDIDESVWASVETKLDNSDSRIILPWWISALGAFLFGLLMSYLWTYSSDNDKDILSPEASITVTESVYSVDTIYVRDTIIITQDRLAHVSTITTPLITQEGPLPISMGTFNPYPYYAAGFMSGILTGSPRYSYDLRDMPEAEISELSGVPIINISDVPIRLKETMDTPKISPTDIRTNHPVTFSLGLVSNFLDHGLKKEKYLHEYKSYGLRFMLHPFDKIRVAGGLEMRQYKGGYDQSLPESLFIPSAIEKRSDIIDFYYKTSFVDIPLVINYSLNNRRTFSPYVGLGIKLSRITEFGADYLLNDGSKLERTVDINESSFFLNSILMNSGINFQNQSGIGAFAELYYRYQINLSVLEFEANHGLGLKLGAFYTF